MFRSVYLKTLYNLRWQLLGWSLAVIFVAGVTMSLYNSLSKSGIEEIVGSVPDSLKPLIGSISDYTTIPGFIGQQVFGPNLYIVTLAMAIILAIGITVSEEDDRRLASLLSLPVSRGRVFIEKWLALATVVIFVSACVLIGVGIGLLVADKTADTARLLQSTLCFGLINLVFATVTFALGLFSGRRSLTIGLASGYAVLSLLITELAPSTDKLDIADKFSLLHYYNNPQIMQSGLSGKHIAVLGAVIVVTLVISWLVFRRRNIVTS